MCATLTARELGATTFLPPTSGLEDGPIDVCATKAWSSGSPQRRHKCCVDRHLLSVEQRQRVGQNLHPTFIELVGGHYVQVLDATVRGDPPTRFAAHAGRHGLHSKPTTS